MICFIELMKFFVGVPVVSSYDDGGGSPQQSPVMCGARELGVTAEFPPAIISHKQRILTDRQRAFTACT